MADRLEQLEKLHADDPDDADVTYMIAMEHLKAADASGGITWFNKTLELDSGYLYAYFQKAKAQSELGSGPDARATLQLGIKKASQANDTKAVSELSELRASMA